MTTEEVIKELVQIAGRPTEEPPTEKVAEEDDCKWSQSAGCKSHGPSPRFWAFSHSCVVVCGFVDIIVDILESWARCPRTAPELVQHYFLAGGDCVIV